MALLAFMLETSIEFLPSICHSQSRTARGCTGRFSLATPPRPAPCTALLHTRLRRRSTARKFPLAVPPLPQSPISTPIPHDLKYRFWSLISLSVAVVRPHSGNCGQMVNIRGILIDILILVADSVGAVQVG